MAVLKKMMVLFCLGFGVVPAAISCGSSTMSVNLEADAGRAADATGADASLYVEVVCSDDSGVSDCCSKNVIAGTACNVSGATCLHSVRRWDPFDHNVRWRTLASGARALPVRRLRRCSAVESADVSHAKALDERLPRSWAAPRSATRCGPVRIQS